MLISKSRWVAKNSTLSLRVIPSRRDGRSIHSQVVAGTTLGDRGPRMGHMHIGRVLRKAREDHEVSQEHLAARSGVAQSAISAYERERRVPGWAAAERLFAALGLQMRIELEPLDADIDRQIDEYAALPRRERLRKVPACLQNLGLLLGGVPLVVTGAAAAALQDVPLAVRRVDLLVPDTDAALDALCASLRTYVARLWDPKRECWQGSACYPEILREFGSTQWTLIDDQIRVTLVDRLPEALTLLSGDAEGPGAPSARARADGSRGGSAPRPHA